MQRLQPMQITQLGSKIKNAEKVRKTILCQRQSSCVQKNRSKKQVIFEKWEHFENCQKWLQCKGYSPCKILSLDQKIKLPKTFENVSTSTLMLLYAKNGSKRQLIFEKLEHFENCQKWPQRKGYSPCKLVIFLSKIKNAEKVRKIILRRRQSFCVQKTAPRNR